MTPGLQAALRRLEGQGGIYFGESAGFGDQPRFLLSGAPIAAGSRSYVLY